MKNYKKGHCDDKVSFPLMKEKQRMSKCRSLLKLNGDSPLQILRRNVPSIEEEMVIRVTIGRKEWFEGERFVN